MKRLIGTLEHIDAKREVRILTPDGILVGRFLVPGVHRNVGEDAYDVDLTPLPAGSRRGAGEAAVS